MFPFRWDTFSRQEPRVNGNFRRAPRLDPSLSSGSVSAASLYSQGGYYDLKQQQGRIFPVSVSASGGAGDSGGFYSAGLLGAAPGLTPGLSASGLAPAALAPTPLPNMSAQPATASSQGMALSPAKQEALEALEKETGCPITQENGQRKMGPPQEWRGEVPSRGCEVFVGKIPRDMLEDELWPALKAAGDLYEVRLMMDFSGQNRGYAFVSYATREQALRAVKQLDNHEIRRGRYLGVCLSTDNCRLFVGGIPKNKTREEIMEEMKKVTDGVIKVIVYPSTADKSKNRGFSFVEYESHRAAAMARRKLLPGKIQLWSHPIAVDWAIPEKDVDPDVMGNVKILYVRNLMLTTTEEVLEQMFSQAAGGEGEDSAAVVERVKKIRDFAFVHFYSREKALKAMEALNGVNVDGSVIEVQLAKPADKSDSRYPMSLPSSTTFLPIQASPPLAPHRIPSYPYLPAPALASSIFAPGIGDPRWNMEPMASNYHPNMNFGYPTRYNPSTSSLNNLQQSGSNLSTGMGMVGPGCVGSAPTLGMPSLAPTGFMPLLGSGAANKGRSFQRRGQRTATGVLREGKGTSYYGFDRGRQYHTNRHPIEVLEEVCARNNWSPPQYQLHSTVSDKHQQLFMYKIYIPSLFMVPFEPDKLCATVEEAKIYAADYVLQSLGLGRENTGQGDYHMPHVQYPDFAPPYLNNQNNSPVQCQPNITQHAAPQQKPPQHQPPAAQQPAHENQHPAQIEAPGGNKDSGIVPQNPAKASAEPKNISQESANPVAGEPTNEP